MSSTERDGVRYFNCCLCDDIFEGWGDNPDPIKDSEGNWFGEDEECCNDFNKLFFSSVFHYATTPTLQVFHLPFHFLKSQCSLFVDFVFETND